MVQFGVKLKANMVEKWREHYVDYTRLKGYIKRYAKEQKGEQVTPAKSKAGGGGGGTAGAKPAPDLEMAPPLGGGTNSSTAGTAGSTTSSTSIASPTSTRRPPKRMGYKSLPPVDLESPGGDRDLDLRADSGTEELLRRHTGLDGDHFGPLTASTRTPSGHLALVDTLRLSEGEMEIGCTRAFVEELNRVSWFYDTKTRELGLELSLLRSAQTGISTSADTGHDDVHTGHDDEPARGRSETFIRPKPETHHARMTVSLEGW